MRLIDRIKVSTVASIVTMIFLPAIMFTAAIIAELYLFSTPHWSIQYVCEYSYVEFILSETCKSFTLLEAIKQVSIVTIGFALVYVFVTWVASRASGSSQMLK